MSSSEAPPAKRARVSARDPATGVSVIAQPLAQDKQLKKTLKLVGKASKAKMLRRGVREVQKALRKQQAGACVFAGDISPIDVICHLPVLCEEAGVPYVFVPSKSELGQAALTKRPTSCIMIVPKKGDSAYDFEEDFDKWCKKLQAGAGDE